jgi:general L-amino acid transport system permease protein
LLSKLAEGYVEIFRNMPLLVQLFLWYTVVLLALPRLDEAIDLWGWVHISNRSVMLPSIVIDSTTLLVLAIIQLVGTRIYTGYLDRESVDDSPAGLRKRAMLWAVALIVFGTLLKLALSLERPELVKPNPVAWGTWHYEGGMPLTLQFLGMMIGLTIYTSVQVAEIVRGSIQSLSRGQVEAAISLGLSPFQRLRLILLPQALRSMIPSLTNQYLNCWKNSSLALVIGYSDFFAISQTIVNNAGQAVPVFVMILVTYQIGSLMISALMNLLNRRVTSVKI